MRKKGFTLVEELGAVVILALLAVILIPVVSIVIKNVDKQTFKDSIIGILESADNYISAKKTIKYDGPIEYPVIFMCDGTSCSNEALEKLEFSGKVPISGKVVIIVENSSASFVTNGKWCASGIKTDLEIASNCNLLDHSDPQVNTDEDVTLYSTTNSILVSFPLNLMYDAESGISKYDVYLYQGDTLIETREYSSPSVLFENLNKNTEYKIVIVATNGNNGTVSTERTISTHDITNPYITYTNVPTGEHEYYNSQTLGVIYVKGYIENPEYYIKSSRAASTDINVIASCGTDTNPGECTTIDTNSIAADTWYKVADDLSVIYNTDSNETASLIALTYDGVNYSGATSRTVAKIENTVPTAPVITGGSNDWTNTARTISVSEAGSAFTGVSKYQYYISTSSSSQTDGSWQDVSGTSVSVSTEGTHYVFFRTVSNAGYASGASNAQIVQVDTQPPGVASGTMRQNNASGTVLSNANAWRNYVVWFGSFTATDVGGAGIDHYEYSGDCTNKSGNLNANYTYNNGTAGNYCIRAVDTAGNPGAWSGRYYFYIDTAAPTISAASVSGKSVTISKADTGGSGLASYCIRTSNSSSGCGWSNNTASSVSWTASSAGTYYAFVKDGAGNISASKSFVIPTTAFCTFTSQDFAYTGGVQSWTVPTGCDGTYKLEVWGAQGGSTNYTKAGGNGGYSTGTKSLTAGTTIYIVVGGQGGSGGGGYNGGGYGGNRSGGGGATHMATTNRGVLSNYNSYRGEVIIVAGGGGGGADSVGGAGGGASGGTGTDCGCGTGGGATQTGGNAFGQGGNGTGHSDSVGSGGGGGWFGGYGSHNCRDYWPAGAGGGSGYVGGVSGGSTTANQRTGSGYARITKQ